MKEFINLFFPLPTWAVWTIRSLVAAIIGLVVYFGRTYFIASKEFQRVILNELEGLYPTPTKWPLENRQIEYILKDKFPRLEIAVHKFRGHLPCCIRKHFDTAWLEYHGGNDDYHNYWPYISTSIVNGKEVIEDNTKTYKKTFRKNVNRLLKYAKQK